MRRDELIEHAAAGGLRGRRHGLRRAGDLLVAAARPCGPPRAAAARDSAGAGGALEPRPAAGGRDGPARRAPRRRGRPGAGDRELAALPRRGLRQHEPRGGAARGVLAGGRPARALGRPTSARGTRARRCAAGASTCSTTTRRSESDVLRCLSLADGREIWRRWYRTGAKRNHGVSRTVPAVTERLGRDDRPALPRPVRGRRARRVPLGDRPGARVRHRGAALVHGAEPAHRRGHGRDRPGRARAA